MSAPGLLPLCFSCSRFRDLDPKTGYFCKAYPRGIPVEIMANVVDHHEPFRGDHGIQFEPKSGMTAIATDPPVSEAQRRAMFASAAGHSNLGIPSSVGKEFSEADPGGKLPARAKDMDPKEFGILKRLLLKFFGEEEREPEHQGADAEPKGRAASIAFVTPDGQALFVKRSSKEENFPDTWALPGGKLDGDETPEAGAMREAREEIGKDCSFDGMKVLHGPYRTPHGWDHQTFAVPVKEPFTPTLNDEHSAHAWAPVTQPPEPLHPGVKATLDAVFDKAAKDEIRHDPASGQFTSGAKRVVETAKTHGFSNVKAEPPNWQMQHVTGETVAGHSDNDKWHHQSRAGSTIRQGQGAEALHGHLTNHRRGASGRDQAADQKLRDYDWSTRKPRRGRAAAVTADMAMDWSGVVALVHKDRDPFIAAFDKGSVRSTDEDGRLHISEANIAKASVNGYLGKEIPDFDKLGLDPERKYMLLRHPDELKKAIDTSNNLPILSKHQAVTADTFPQDLVVGSTGSEAKWQPPFVTNSLAFWPRKAIDEIESNVKKELSPAYRYTAEMTSGEHDGVHYDGVMRNIRFNHLAQVVAGRQGKDVVVGDSQIYDGGLRIVRWRRTIQPLRENSLLSS